MPEGPVTRGPPAGPTDGFDRARLETAESRGQGGRFASCHVWRDPRDERHHPCVPRHCLLDQFYRGRTRRGVRLHARQLRVGGVGLPDLRSALEHAGLCVCFACRRLLLWDSGRMAGRADEFAGQDDCLHTDDHRSADAGLCRCHGLAVPDASTHRPSQYLLDRGARPRRGAVRYIEYSRHGLGSGAQSGATLVHHDGRGIPRDGSLA